MAKFTLFKHYVPVGKCFYQNPGDGSLEKHTNGILESAIATKETIESVWELQEYIENADGYSHFTTGIHKQNEVDVLAEKYVGDGQAARSDKYFKHSSKHPGIMLIDVDDIGEGDDPYNELVSVVPELGKVNCLETISSSSNIRSVFGGEFHGVRGKHLYFLVNKPSEIPRLLEIFHKRLMIAGKDRSRSSHVGGYLERTIVDLQLRVPSQPIYLKPNLTGALIQDKRFEYHGVGCEAILRAEGIQDLSATQEKEYHKAVALSRERLNGEMQEKRAQWMKTQPNQVSANMALKQQMLDGDFELHTHEGPVLVKDLEDRHHGMTCQDPFGDGTGSFTQAKIFNKQDVPMVISYAHGGMKYRLMDASKCGFGPAVIDGDSGTVISGGETPIEYVRNEEGEIIDYHNGCFTPLGANVYERWLINQSNSKPKSHYHNFDTIAEGHGIRLRYNEVSNLVEFTGRKEFTDNANHNATVIKSYCTLNDMAIGEVDAFIGLNAYKNRFNPVMEMLQCIRWDGVSRLRELFNTLDVQGDDEIPFMLFHKWLVGAYRIVTRQTDEFGFVLVLQQLRGGEGKSRWFKRLVPEKYLFRSTDLNVKDKDDLLKSTQCWIAELGELDAIFDKQALKSLMAFLTSDKDIIRAPYDRVAVERPRRTAFCATVNSERFLRDDSGDRRFWPIRVGRVDYEHNIDMRQVWAEIHETTPADFRHWLDTEENIMITDRNSEEFKVEDPVITCLENYFSRDTNNDNTVFKTLDDIMHLAGWKTNLSQAARTKANNWLKNSGYELHRKQIKGAVNKSGNPKTGSYWEIPNFQLNNNAGFG